MLFSLFYNIADYHICLRTTSVQNTRTILPTFEPFFCDASADSEPLFILEGNCAVSLPSDDYLVVKRESGEGEARIYRKGNQWFVYRRIRHLIYHFMASEHWDKMYTDMTLTERQETPILSSMIAGLFGLTAARYGIIKMHASVIELKGEALLFLGVSGTGKSTHSRLWKQYVKGATLLNDDEPIVRIFPHGEVLVYGSPWSGKTPCYRNASARIKGFVHLRQHKENVLTLLSPLEALSSLLISTSLFRPDAKSDTLIEDTVCRIINQVPVYRLDCRPDEEAVRLTEALLKREKSNT